MNTSATGADVIQVLRPVMTQWPSISSARVVIALRSLPASGSVMQMVPMTFPASMSATRRSRTSPLVCRCTR